MTNLFNMVKGIKGISNENESEFYYDIINDFKYDSLYNYYSNGRINIWFENENGLIKIYMAAVGFNKIKKMDPKDFYKNLNDLYNGKRLNKLESQGAQFKSINKKQINVLLNGKILKYKF